MNQIHPKYYVLNSDSSTAHSVNHISPWKHHNSAMYRIQPQNQMLSQFTISASSTQKSWLTSPTQHTAVFSRGYQGRPLSLASPCKSRRFTHSMTAGTWPASSSFSSSSSLSCLWLPWPCSMSYWTVGAVSKERRIASSRRRGREVSPS